MQRTYTHRQLTNAIKRIAGENDGDGMQDVIDVLTGKETYDRGTLERITRAFMFAMDTDKLKHIMHDIFRARPDASHILFHMDRLLRFVRARIDAGETDHWMLCDACAREFALYRDDKFPVWMSRVIEGELRDASDNMREDIPD